VFARRKRRRAVLLAFGKLLAASGVLTLPFDLSSSTTEYGENIGQRLLGVRLLGGGARLIKLFDLLVVVDQPAL
jgi:hypothetical protein